MKKKVSNLKNISEKEFNKIVDEVIEYPIEKKSNLKLTEIKDDKALEIIIYDLYKRGVI